MITEKTSANLTGWLHRHVGDFYRLLSSECALRCIEAGPIPAAHDVVRWRIIDLIQWLWEDFEVSISKQALGHELPTMGYRKLSARPRHQGQCPEDIAALEKPSPPVSRKSEVACPKAR